MFQKSIYRFLIVNVTILFAQLDQNNPWIYSNYSEPVKENIYIVSMGIGGLTNEYSKYGKEIEIPSFKYASLSEISNTSYSGYSISGWWYEDHKGLDGSNWETTKYTSFLFAYSKMQTLTNKEEFKGLYSSYDIGLTFGLYDKYPLGLTLEPISAFFNNNERTNIGIGLRYEIGYALNNFAIFGNELKGDLMISAKFGIDIIGKDDFIFIDGLRHMFDHVQILPFNLSYKF